MKHDTPFDGEGHLHDAPEPKKKSRIWLHVIGWLLFSEVLFMAWEMLDGLRQMHAFGLI